MCVRTVFGGKVNRDGARVLQRNLYSSAHGQGCSSTLLQSCTIILRPSDPPSFKGYNSGIYALFATRPIMEKWVTGVN